MDRVSESKYSFLWDQRDTYRILRRTKISHDPNNTNWSRTTSNYGHKLLLSQGWTPGTHLGSTNAPHKHLQSDASASFIRVAMKDDNLGLGARRGQNPGECTGLDAFQGLLGRLNGKSDAALEKEQRSRDSLKRALYIEGRWGTLGFVSGGLLVGSEIQKLPENGCLDISPEVQSGKTSPGKKDQGKSINFKASAEEFVEQSEPARIKLLHAEAYALEEDNVAITDVRETASEYGEKKIDQDVKICEKAQRKAERIQRQLDKMERKETRKIKKLEKENRSIPLPSTTLPMPIPQGTPTINLRTRTSDSLPFQPIESTVTASITGRHAIRQRYIRQKKMALMDPKALNEVSEHEDSPVLSGGINHNLQQY